MSNENRMGNMPDRSMEGYDTSLQMFVQNVREPDIRKLAFLRWLVENDRLEHRVAGPISGSLATPEDITKPSFLKRGVKGVPQQSIATGPAELRRTL